SPSRLFFFALYPHPPTPTLFPYTTLFRSSVQQAVSGLFGVAVAAFIAHRTGTAKGYFLFGIWASFGYAGLFFASLLARWPLVGVIWEYVESGGAAWRGDRRRWGGCSVLTLVWGGGLLNRRLGRH